MNDVVADPTQDGIDFAALWKVVLAYKWLIVVVTALITAGTVAISLLITPVFRAEAVVADVQDTGMGGGSSLLGQLGGLANLAGVNVGAGGIGQEAHAVLKSRYVIEEFIRRHQLLPVLLSEGTEKQATLWFAVKRFKENVLFIREDKRNGTTSVAIEWKEPKTAALWANEFVALANEILRARALDESTRNIGYLNGQLEQTNVVELERVIYNLIESETKTLMLANARTEYAFKVVDPSVAPEVRIRPRRKIMVMFGAALGAVCGVLIALGYDKYIRRRRSTNPAS